MGQPHDSEMCFQDIKKNEYNIGTGAKRILVIFHDGYVNGRALQIFIRLPKWEVFVDA